MKTRLKISGMKCQGCANNVALRLRSVPGVRSVDVDLAQHAAVIEHEESTQDALTAALAAAGYRGEKEERI